MDTKTISEIRTRLGLTQDEAAKLIGVSRQAWQKWETGERNMPKPTQYLLWLIEHHPGSRKIITRLGNQTERTYNTWSNDSSIPAVMQPIRRRYEEQQRAAGL
jgi:transcriptional regulator with XRE-family HTH domain